MQFKVKSMILAVHALILKCCLSTCRAPWFEGAQAGGGAAEQRGQVLEGRWPHRPGRDRFRSPVRPPVQTPGEAARAADALHPGPPEDLLPEAGGPGSSSSSHR